MRTTTRWMICSAAFCAAAAVTSTARAEATFDVNEWMKLRFGGDFRLAEELDIERTSEELAPRYSPFVRARLAAGAVIVDTVDIGFRVVTGNPQREVDSDQSLTDGFSSWALSLDNAYVRWTPESLGGSYIVAGKFEHPFYKRPVYGHMMWDEDVQPAGAALSARVPIGKFFEAWRLVGGAFYYQENGEALFGGEDASGEDGILLVGQTSFHFELAEGLKVTLAGGVHHLPDPTPAGSGDLFGRNQGNTTVDLDGDGIPDEFVAGFTVLDGLLGLHYEGSTIGLDVSAQLIANVRADEDDVRDIDQNRGIGVGLAVPITFGRHDSKLIPWADLQIVEREAVFSAWAQDDNQRTVGHRAIIGGIKFRPREWMELHPWVLTSKSIDDGEAPLAVRARLDLDFMF